MSDTYVQSIDVEVSKNAKSMQWAGICLVLASFGFVFLSAFYSWWFMFAFGAIFASGGVCLHFYNKTAKEYTYEFSKSRLRVVAKDVVNRQRIYLDLMWNDAQSFEIMQDTYDKKTDLLCASKAYEDGIWQIKFTADGIDRSLLFKPDEYMIALIKQLRENK